MRSWNLTNLNEILAEVEAGNVRPRKTGDLTIYKYTEDCSLGKLWNRVNRLCRGIVADESGNIVARPISKFFNLNENDESSFANLPWHLPYTVETKEDGACGILFFHKNKWNIATPGSLESDQAIVGSYLLGSYGIEYLDTKTTYILEIIHPETRQVVVYDDNKLVLLAAIDENWQELGIDELDQIANLAGFDRPVRWNVDHSMLQQYRFPTNMEGFVVKFANGFRIKIKSEEYVKLHNMVSGITPKQIRQYLMDESLPNWSLLPSHMVKLADDICANLRTKFSAIQDICSKLMDVHYRENQKEFAIEIKQHVDAKYHGILFNMKSGKSCDKLMWKLVDV